MVWTGLNTCGYRARIQRTQYRSNQSFSQSMPERQVSGRNKVRWWNQELKSLRREANRALHEAYRFKSDQEWQANKAARTAFKKEFRCGQRNTWRDFCARVASTPQAARLYKLIGKSNTCALGMLQLPSRQ